MQNQLFQSDILVQAEGFPSDYILEGTQADKKKFIGNAVEVNQARVILKASVEGNFNN